MTRLVRANEFALDLKICGIAICDQTSFRKVTADSEVSSMERGNSAKEVLCLIAIVFPSTPSIPSAFEMRKNVPGFTSGSLSKPGAAHSECISILNRAMRARGVCAPSTMKSSCNKLSALRGAFRARSFCPAISLFLTAME